MANLDSILGPAMGGSASQPKPQKPSAMSLDSILGPSSRSAPATPAAPAQPSWQNTLESVVPTPKPSLLQRVGGGIGSAVRGVGDFMNRQQQRNDEAGFRLQQQTSFNSGAYKTKDPITGKTTRTTPKLEEYNLATPERKGEMIKEQHMKAPVMRALNSETGKKVTGAIFDQTADAGLKVEARVRSMGDQTYDQALQALKAKSVDPTNDMWERLRYGVQTSGVQSAIGTLLAVGATYATRNPMVGKAVAGGYFAPIAAESQRREKGQVENLGNIAIDTVGDTILSGMAESALKSVVASGGASIAKNLAVNFGKGFAVEGSTEVTQTILKYANDYQHAKSNAEKQQAVDSLARYVKEGGAVDEFLIGGISGGLITGGSGLAGQVTNTDNGVNHTRQNILSSGHDYDAAIKSGDATMGQIFNTDGTLKPSFTDHTVSDIAGKLNMYQKGLGDAFVKTVDISNPTVKSLTDQGVMFLENVVRTGAATKSDPNFVAPKTPADVQKKEQESVPTAPQSNPVVSANAPITEMPVTQETSTETNTEGAPSAFTPGDTLNLVNKQGVNVRVKFLQMRPEGILAEDPRFGVPVLFRKDLFTVSSTPETKISTTRPVPANQLPKPGPKQVLPKPQAQQGRGDLRVMPELREPNTTSLRPEQRVNKTDLKSAIATLPGKEVVFAVVKKGDGRMTMRTATPKGSMFLRPSALGLVEENLKDGDNITISAEDLKKKGTALQARDGETVVASLATELGKDIDPARSPSEMRQRIEQLNKFGQSHAILRRTGGLSKKAAGLFRYKRDGSVRGTVHLQDDVVGSPKNYMSTLAHELGHAMEYTLTGATNKDTWRVFGKDLPKEVTDKIHAELKAVTIDLEGEARVRAGVGYYFQKTELLARFLQKMFQSPGNLAELAPTAVEYFEKSAVETPIIGEYLEAVRGEIDKGERKFIFLRDMKQTYQRLLGTRVGAMAWNDEVRYRAMKERAKLKMEEFVGDKFKGVKDDPETLFRAAESIKVTKSGVPEFGTRDFTYAKNKQEAAPLLAAGWTQLKNPNGTAIYEIINDEKMFRFAKERYSPEDGKRIFASLSPEGQQLIKDFTAAREEAKDHFNREVIKDVHKINSVVEGWVHHYWDDATGVEGGKDRLKYKVASAKKHREGNTGYVEDLQKAMQKALTELETTKAYNSFIDEYFARVTKPIQKGVDADPGWMEVVGNVKKGGVGTRNEVQTTVIKDGKVIPIQKARYQMPKEIYERYQMISEVAHETATALRVLNSLNRYWRVNILFHPGSAMTNFLSGGLQYGSKVMTDFYMEILTGNATLPQTRKNIFSMFTVLSPKGWQNAPDWIYGGDLSNFYGQFGRENAPGIKALDKNVDAYADKALLIYGKVERYWKKVIATAENAGDLKKLNMITKEGLKLPNAEEREIMDELNKEVDLFAYDYDNVPVWLQNYQQSAGWQSVKPFAKYPYKYTKHWTEMIHQAFDRTLPWQERMAKILALATIMAAYAAVREDRKEEQKTKETPIDAPSQVSTRGRFFVGTDEDGKEIFTRVAKYPFINLTEAGLQFAEGNGETGRQSLTDMVGSIAPIGEIGAAMLGYRNEYQQFTPFQVVLAEDLVSFVPGTRILQDITKFFDPYQRKRETFMEGIGSVVPVTVDDEALRRKLHGEIRTIKVPLEGNIEAGPEEGRRRTTTDMFVKNYRDDVLWGALAGIYRKRIDPEVADAFVLRKEVNEEKAREKAEQ